MNRRAFSKTARILSAAKSISSNAQAQEFDPTAIGRFKEILGYPDEQLNQFLQNPANRYLLPRLENIAKNQILLEMLKKTL